MEMNEMDNQEFNELSASILAEVVDNGRIDPDGTHGDNPEWLTESLMVEVEAEARHRGIKGLMVGEVILWGFRHYDLN